MLDSKRVAFYEATVTTGLENIAKDEVKEKLNADATMQQGRIWFSTDARVERILSLKSVCNIFVIIHDQKLGQDEMPTDSDGLEPLLFKVGDCCDWSNGLTKWQESGGFACSMENLLTKDTELKARQPKFRVTCNRYGPDHAFTSPEICSIFGHVVDTKFGWPIKMKDFDLEIMVNFNYDHLYVGLTLTPIALDRRNIVSTGFTTLRAATCYALLRTARIKSGDIVIDPMAGSGAIPVECCDCWSDEWQAYTMAGELQSIPLEKCRINLDIFKQKPPFDLIQLDVTYMPLRDCCIDVVVSDLPFGRRHGSKRANKTLYPALLHNLSRIVRPGTGRAVLLTQDFKSMNLAYDRNRKFWFQKLCHFVKIGNLNCYIYLFLRNQTLFVQSTKTIT